MIPFTESALEPILVTPRMKQIWKNIGRWGTFLSIVSLIGSFFSLIILLVSLTFRGIEALASAGAPNSYSSGISWINLFSLAVNGLTIAGSIYFLLYFSQIKKALRTDNQEALRMSFLYLLNHYRYFVGAIILSLVMLAGVLYYFTYSAGSLLLPRF